MIEATTGKARRVGNDPDFSGGSRRGGEYAAHSGSALFTATRHGDGAGFCPSAIRSASASSVFAVASIVEKASWVGALPGPDLLRVIPGASKGARGAT